MGGALSPAGGAQGAAQGDGQPRGRRRSATRRPCDGRAGCSRSVRRPAHHDHIVKVQDGAASRLGEYEGVPALLLEYVDGIDAHGLLQQGPLPPRVGLEIVAAVASALDAASNATSLSTG